jgi:hypothetical protein
MRSLAALATAKSGGEVCKQARRDAQFARTGRKVRARPGRAAAPGAQHTNREDSRNLTAVRADAASAPARAQWTPWARTGLGHNAGNASIRAARCAA